MGLMDKVKFWKGDDDFDLDTELPPIDDEFSDPAQGPAKYDWDKQDQMNARQAMQQPMSNSFEQPQPFQGMPAPSGNMERDLELISSKLDTIKAELDSMNQRLKKIEAIAEGEKSKPGKTRASRDPWSNY